MDTFDALLGIVQIIILIAGGFFLKSYLPTYLAEKGKNLATKEDIKDITEKIEAVRSQYAKQQHMHQMAFDKEFDILSEVWATLVDLRNATLGLRPILDYSHPNETEEKRKRLQKFAECYNAFTNIVEKNKPFYPKQIYQPLFEIMMVTSDESAQFSYWDPNRRPFNQQYWDKALENQRSMLEAIDKVCEQIRERITA
jgi:hypothetical protein